MINPSKYLFSFTMRHSRQHFGLTGVLILCMMLMAGCVGDELSDLKEHVAKAKAKKGERIPPLPTFETYVMIPYAAAHLRDPFMPDMEITDAAPVAAKSEACPPATHKAEPLEKYPLDGLKFVGVLERQNERWAIISAPDKLVHRVKVGNFLGQNYGRITAISEARVEVLESVSDSTGGCVERQAALSVVE